jgi:hypothetical protein
VHNRHNTHREQLLDALLHDGERRRDLRIAETVASRTATIP